MFGIRHLEQRPSVGFRAGTSKVPAGVRLRFFGPLPSNRRLAAARRGAATLEAIFWRIRTGTP